MYLGSIKRQVVIMQETCTVRQKFNFIYWNYLSFMFTSLNLFKFVTKQKVLHSNSPTYVNSI